MIRILLLLSVIFTVSSCSDRTGTGKFYTNAKWQKFRKDYDLGKLKDRPKKITENVYTDLDDTTFEAKGKYGGFESFAFNVDGDLEKWQSWKSDSEWVIQELQYDANGMLVRFYTNRDTLHTFHDAGLVVSRKLNNNRFLLHSYINIGPAFMLVTFYNAGQTVKKEYIIDSSKLEDVFKTVTTYYSDELLQKAITTTKDGFQQLDNYFYSAGHVLDSSSRLESNKLNQKEFFMNNTYGDPVSYVLQRFPRADTIQYVTLKYVYDSHGNWIKRLENKIKGNYTPEGKNPHYTLVIRDIIYP